MKVICNYREGREDFFSDLDHPVRSDEYYLMGWMHAEYDSKNPDDEDNDTSQ